MRAVLTYHSVDPSGSPVSVGPEVFRAQVAWLASGAVRVVSLLDLLAMDPDGPDAVALTFDDALESFGSVAAPLLLEAALPVTVFVVSDRVGARSDWAGTGGAVPVFSVLSWQELGRLAAAGIDIGAHSRTHPRLTNVTDTQLVEEIEGCGELIQRELGVRARTFSYPYGAHDDRVAAVVSGCGYAASVTTHLALLPRAPDPHRLPRLDMYYFRDSGRPTWWGTPMFHAYVSLRRAGRRVRDVAGRSGA